MMSENQEEKTIAHSARAAIHRMAVTFDVVAVVVVVVVIIVDKYS